MVMLTEKEYKEIIKSKKIRTKELQEEIKYLRKRLKELKKKELAKKYEAKTRN